MREKMAVERKNRWAYSTARGAFYCTEADGGAPFNFNVVLDRDVSAAAEDKPSPPPAWQVWFGCHCSGQRPSLHRPVTIELLEWRAIFGWRWCRVALCSAGYCPHVCW